MPSVSSSIDDWRRSRTAFRDEVRAAYAAGASGLDLAACLTKRTDELVCRIARTVFPAVDTAQVAFLAVGGYGRCHLAPESDLDLWCFTENALTKDLTRQLARFERVLWDVGFRPSFACRSPADLAGILPNDVATATATLDSRFLLGARSAFNRFRSICKDNRQRHGHRLAGQLLEGMELSSLDALRELHALEPNIKTSRFLLRDLLRVRWIAEFAGPAQPAAQATLDTAPAANPAPGPARNAADFFLRARFGLHLAAGRPDDQLRQEAQIRLAREFGFAGDDDATRVRAFLQHLYRHERDVYLAVATTVECFRDFSRAVHARLGRRPRVALTSDLVRIGNTLHFSTAHPGERDPQPRLPDVLEAFAWAARLTLDMPFSTRNTIRRLAAGAPVPSPSDFRAVGKILRGILDLHRPVGRVLVHLHFTDMLKRVLPEYNALDCLPEFGAYHRYTVDAHSILAAAEFDQLTGGHTPRELERYRLLLPGSRPFAELRFAALTHDAGKALGPNHSKSGARIVRTAARRLGFSADACDEMSFLVLHHLLFSHATQFRNIEAPELADRLAGIVKTRTRLNSLMLLTFADMRCAGRSAWSGWKEAQLWALFQRVTERLAPGHGAPRAFRQQLALYRPGIDDPVTTGVIEAHVQRVDWPQYRDETPFPAICQHARLALEHKSGTVQVATRTDQHTARVTVVCDDAPGLFSQLAGSLTAAGLTVLAGACCTRRDGIAIDEFTVQDARSGNPPTPAQLEQARKAVKRVIRGKDKVDALLARRRRTFPDAPAHPAAVLEVKTDDAGSQHCTVIEIRAPDRTGLLYELGRAMEKLGLDIRFVKIATTGGQAMDTFYVVDAHGRKLALGACDAVVRNLEQVAAGAAGDLPAEHTK